jgi:ribonuclease P protein component
MNGRRVFAGEAVVAFAAPNSSGGWRVGVTVSRRVRGAVLRNRIRRRLREAARARLLSGDSRGADRGIGYDVVLIGRPALAALPATVVEEEAAAVRDRLVQG